MKKHILSKNCWCKPEVISFKEVKKDYPPVESNSTQNETHNVCNERLAREGGQARCCDCEPHEGCTLGMKPTQQDTLQDAVQDIQNDWEKRFDEEFPNLRMHYSDGIAPCEDDVKAFIAKELADARKEERMKSEVEMGLKNFKVTMEEIFKARKEVIEKVGNFEQKVNVFDMSKDCIDDDNRMLARLIADCRQFLATLKEEVK